MTTLGILSAQYSRADRTAAVVETDVGARLITADDAEFWPQVLAFGPQDFPTPAQPVPASVTMRQAQRALYAVNLLQYVNDAIDAMPGADGDLARIDWKTGATVERASPLVSSMGAVLQMDAAALDDLFRQAAAL